MRQYGEGIQINYDTPHKDGTPAENGMIHSNRESLSSDSSIAKHMITHRRAESDPFDTAGLDDTGDMPVDDYSLLQEEKFALPTLQRFPFAETNNRNCWSEPPSTTFEVRGKDYFKDKKKVTATSYLLRARGSDLFLSDKPTNCEVSR